MPDPLRAHGAWVYLSVSVLAGVLTVADRGFTAALCAGGGCVGVFVLAGALAVGGRRAAPARLGLGLTMTAGLSILALALGADRSFLVLALIAIPPILVAARFAGGEGFLSPGALAFGVAALVVSAPVAASAGGAGPRESLLLFAGLTPIFSWRTWQLARALGAGWTRQRFQRRGLLESGIAVAWAVAVVAVTRLFG